MSHQSTMIICGNSALDYHRVSNGAQFPGYEEILVRSMRTIRKHDQHFKRVVEVLDQLDLPAPLHLLSTGPGDRKNSVLAKYHYYAQQPQVGDLIKLDENIYVCAPELALAQASVRAGIAAIDLLILEFCGTYLLSPRSDSGFIGTSAPLLTLAQIEQAFKDKKRVPGYAMQPRLQALEVAAENSNSPAESAVHAILSLPVGYGGYGVSGIELNRKIPLDSKAARMVGVDAIRPDFFIGKANTVGEYKSLMYHPEGTWTNDDRRIDAFESMGYHTFTLNNERVRNLPDLTTIAQSIQTRSGELMIQPSGEDLMRRLDLHRRLFHAPTQTPRSSNYPSKFGRLPNSIDF
ncbi:hypothetical protein [Paratractidigestivibacter sp.]|uniref:hypothetical protein n=1 Tax=Paratractidigestivibacter sp. TaxID=2847316 RepID=UPI002AC8EB60|nr:hypothetical protein [Paratractidigestivibacter sp.]